MIASNTKASAERLRRYVSGEISVYDMTKGDYRADCIAIRDAYFAEHPADDDEPVTEDWLTQTLHRSFDSSFAIGGLSLYQSLGDWILVDVHGREYAEMKTRRQVRLLCLALGLELKKAK
jgi:hypothetical protein